MFKIVFRPNHKLVLATASTRERAERKLVEIEQDNKRNDCFVPDAYEIIETPDRPKRRANGFPCLCVKAPWAEQIVSGTKKIEYRSRLTARRGRIGIIQSGTGTVIGDVEITSAEWGGDYAEWHLRRPRKYKHPIPYNHPFGAVVWVRVPITPQDIEKALK